MFFILAEFPIDPNAIVVFVMVVVAGIKALLEKKNGQNTEAPTPDEDEDYYDPYAEYEAELRRQEREQEIREQQRPPVEPKVITRIPSPRAEVTPPPISVPEVGQRTTPTIKTPVRPQLSPAEKAALENLNLVSRSKKRVHSSTKTRIRRHLASPTAAREALLLAEILGPPKALRSDEQV